MRIGILSGAFDPIHNGHMAAAEAAARCLRLDTVLLTPVDAPKGERRRASREDRLHMIELACAGRRDIVPCTGTAPRGGEGIEGTLRSVRQVHPADTLYYIMGEDAEPLPEELCAICDNGGDIKLAAVGHSGREAQSLSGAAVENVCAGELRVTSRMVRDCVAENGRYEELVPEGVGDYIRAKGLYLCEYSEEEILERLKKTISLHRWHHTLGVAETATRLSGRCGVDPMRARLAALLHDCAKSLPYGEMRRIVSEGVPDADEMELDAEPVLHAPAGMVLAKRDYGVRDPMILQAIRRHTLGGPDMTPMDALIYVSDFIEPGRRPFPGLEEARTLAETDIFAAMRLCARLSTDYLISRGQRPHPRTIALTGGEVP